LGIGKLLWVCNYIRRNYNGADVILNLVDVTALNGVMIVNILHWPKETLSSCTRN